MQQRRLNRGGIESHVGESNRSCYRVDDKWFPRIALLTIVRIYSVFEGLLYGGDAIIRQVGIYLAHKIRCGSDFLDRRHNFRRYSSIDSLLVSRSSVIDISHSNCSMLCSAIEELTQHTVGLWIQSE